MSRAGEVDTYCYAIEYAGSRSEVLAELVRFVRDLKNSYAIALLPEAFQGLTPENSAQIDVWLAAVRAAREDGVPRHASTRFWLGELTAVFDVADRRLRDLQSEDEPSHSKPEGASGSVAV
jgi:hypothetical protein